MIFENALITNRILEHCCQKWNFLKELILNIYFLTAFSLHILICEGSALQKNQPPLPTPTPKADHGYIINKKEKITSAVLSPAKFECDNPDKKRIAGLLLRRKPKKKKKTKTKTKTNRRRKLDTFFSLCPLLPSLLYFPKRQKRSKSKMS